MTNLLTLFNILILMAISYWLSFDFNRLLGAFLTIFGAASSLYIFIFRQHKAMLMKSIKSINDLLIKNNEKFIDSMLHDVSEIKGKNELEKDRKKVSLYLTFIKVEIDNFPCGGPITSAFKNAEIVKNIKKNINIYYSDYQEAITLDTVIESPSIEITKKNKDLMIDRAIHLSSKITSELEKQLKINF